MWTVDDFPGAENVPWQLLIRARFAHELDAVIASTVVSRVGKVASLEVTRRIAAAASAAVVVAELEASSDAKVGALSALADFDDWPCGTPWPGHWPPRPRGFEELGDPVTVLVLQQALKLVQVAGSELLQKSLGEAIAEVGGIRG